jgi:hypothetical protein
VLWWERRRRITPLLGGKRMTIVQASHQSHPERGEGLGRGRRRCCSSSRAETRRNGGVCEGGYRQGGRCGGCWGACEGSLKASPCLQDQRVP